MPEERFAVIPYMLQYKCELCPSGYMAQENIEPIIKQDITWWAHKCTVCGREMDYKETYPKIVYEYVENKEINNE